ncbi:MAG TPA: hypothetical protein VIJ54_08370 [Actinomycetes bacterium]
MLVVSGTSSALEPMTDASSADYSATPRTGELATDGSMAFALPVLKPGDTGAHCQTVSYRGSSPAALRVYATDEVSTRGMGSNLLLSITAGTSRGSQGCRDLDPSRLIFAGPFVSLPTSWGAASPVILTGSGQQNVDFRISYELSPATPNDVQGGTARVRLVWEVRVIAS